jgi:hypothetical protein
LHPSLDGSDTNKGRREEEMNVAWISLIQGWGISLSSSPFCGGGSGWGTSPPLPLLLKQAHGIEEHDANRSIHLPLLSPKKDANRSIHLPLLSPKKNVTLPYV